MTKKITLFFIALNLLFTIDIYANTSENSLELLLKSIQNNSSQIKILKSEEKSKIITQDVNNLIFKPEGSIEGTYTDQENLNSINSRLPSLSREYQLSVDKLWKFGVRSKLSYTLSDLSYDNNTVERFSPKLELSLSTKIFQDLVSKRYSYTFDETINNIDAIKKNYQILSKQVLIKGIISFLSYLETKEELSFQRKLCIDTKKQSRQIDQKRKRKSVSNKDYYLSQKEVVLCSLIEQELNKNLTTIKNNFESNYGTKIDTFNNISVNDLFNSIEKIYYQNKSSSIEVDLSQSVDIAYLESLLKAEKSKLLKLEAASKNDLSLEVAGGVRGFDDSLSTANDDVTDFNNPFILLGLKMGLPWNNRAAKQKLAAGQYNLKAVESNYKQEKLKLEDRFKTLSQTLEADFSIYKKYNKSLSLSKKILKEARRDFSNGRINFSELIDFNKTLINDQKSISTFRVRHIERTVEYLDLYNYFSSYIEQK